MKIRDNYTCPLEITHDLTKGKWKPLILWQLKAQAHSLADLERAIQGVTQKVLMEQLKSLVECGMVHKKIFEGYPLRVEFTLLDRGHKMLEAITIMQGIGIEMMREKGLDEVLRAKGFIE